VAWNAVADEHLRTRRQDGHRQTASLSEAFAYLSRHRALFGLQLVGYALIALAAYGVGTWIPTVFIRSHGWTAAQAGINYGFSLTLLGLALRNGLEMASEQAAVSISKDSHPQVEMPATSER
jgi:hypothetical protein